MEEEEQEKEEQEEKEREEERGAGGAMATAFCSVQARSTHKPVQRGPVRSRFHGDGTSQNAVRAYPRRLPARSLRLSRWQPSGALPGLQGHGCALQEPVGGVAVLRDVRYHVAPVSRIIHLRRGADRNRVAV